ncbi:MAG: carbohydrate ABC transporter permease [Anaerolineales bacterium]|nr:carbohydrate ABC transporter permease [Anaerolineales bacterium]
MNETNRLSLKSTGITVRPRDRTKRRHQIQQIFKSLLTHTLVIVAAIAIGFPFYYMISTSLKSVAEVYSVPMVIFPDILQWENFKQVWEMLPFGRFALNSLIYAGGITVGEFCMGLTAGYAFGRLDFPKKDIIFFAVLMTLMIPAEITLVPNFILLNKLGWVNTYKGLILPQLSSAFTTFMLREHFSSLPDEIFDAASIDGAGHIRQMLQVALPISKPIVVTLLLLTFVTHWNAYLWPLIVTNSRDMRTLPIGIQEIRAMLEFPEWQLIMAGATIVVLPLVIIFLIGQRQFIEGTVHGAIKG